MARLSLAERLIAWFRRVTDSCAYGPWHPRRPVGTWMISETFRPRLCAPCKEALEELAGPLGDDGWAWVPD